VASSFPIGGVDRDRASEPEKRHAGKTPGIEELHRKLVAPYAPQGIIVNADHDVVHTLGGGESYLKFVSGRPTQDIFKVVREELRLELRTALYQAFHKKEGTRSRPITVRLDGRPGLVELIVEPIQEP
jgi:two-component system, chemotaxis family, CheB/CheR fusion protein